ncbi:sigma-54 interaction domain-containing protein [Clostridium peptidivorans]|uniref:sigma-54 interaction domain-containing protein n=1 Tax=Clostridium peptidivorans TaxID=100174 RepID=UPI000BE29004|nr:sigma 54-interacting transcriptional regulator [Clostridium peptidivorans]
MISYDVICFLNENDILEHIEYCNFNSNYDDVSIWNKYIGKDINSFLNINLSKNSGYANWNGTVLRFTKVRNVMGSGFVLYITKGVDDSKIFMEALDCISEGIQVFDQNGYLLFCNRFSEKIEKTNRTNIIGKHLLDIYDLKKEYSTILNTIKSKKPVINRCDHFKNKNGEVITTMNSGYPLFVEDKLIGAVGLVQDTLVSEQYQEKSAIFEKFLSGDKGDKLKNKKKNYYGFKYHHFNDLIGEDEGFKEAVHLAQNISKRDCSILIYGETGTGKELFAQSIHSDSLRKNNEFIAINCAAIPENLIESILFGTEKGSFTGSVDRIGLFEQAEGGTLFLDEINSMNIYMQSKLLRVLQENKFRRVGGLKDIECDVRIISSTNEEPIYCIENNKIRKDVYYRISTVTINIPPLRARRRDIPILVQCFIERLSRIYSMQVKGVSSEVINIFKEYNWPGNVRELTHVIEHCFNTMTDDIIQVNHLPKFLKDDENASEKENLDSKLLKDLMEESEKDIIRNALKRCNNNVTRAAEELGVMRQSLQYRIKKYKL